jgi:uncharacterized Zn-finger protein
LMKHTNERPHACQFCPQRFSQRGNLRAHIEVPTPLTGSRCCIFFLFLSESTQKSRVNMSTDVISVIVHSRNWAHCTPI